MERRGVSRLAELLLLLCILLILLHLLLVFLILTVARCGCTHLSSVGSEQICNGELLLFDCLLIPDGDHHACSTAESSVTQTNDDAPFLVFDPQLVHILVGSV